MSDFPTDPASDRQPDEGRPDAERPDGLPAEGFDASFTADADDTGWFAADDFADVTFGEVAFPDTGEPAIGEPAEADGFQPFAADGDAWPAPAAPEPAVAEDADLIEMFDGEPAVHVGDAGAVEHDAVDSFFSGGPVAAPAAAPVAALGGGDDFGGGDFGSGGFEPETFADDAAPAEPDTESAVVATPKPKKAKKASRKESLVLGVQVTPKQVYAVLVRSTPEGYEPLRQFVRTRNESAGGFGGDLGADFGGALVPDAGTDFGTDSADDGVMFGGGAEVDFSAEFAGLGSSAADDSFGDLGDGLSGSTAQPILFEIKDILEECNQAGYARPALAFTVGGADVEYLEVLVEPDKKARAKKKKDPDSAAKVAPVKRDKLVALLPEGDLPIDKERVAFLEMTPQNGMPRYLAVIPTPSEPVVPSLRMLREQREHRKTAFRAIEAEVPLLVGLADVVLQAQPHENTALVRVGAEDTMVLLLQGRQLRHAETMPSVTAFDGPDTICSRVLLQQDVQGVGAVHNVVVISEEREGEIVQGFAAFYPESRVEAMRDGLARLGLVGPYGALPSELVEAAGAALAGHLSKGDSAFGEASILPKDVMKSRRRVELAFGWHTLVVGVALFLAAVFFVYLYIAQAGEITQAERTLAEFPAEAQMTAPQLQARIDSLRLRQAELTASLVTLDSLLIGTDKWTQTLLKTTRAASATGSVWIEEWSPSGSELTIRGYATSRDRVVGLAQRLTASIDELTYQSVRDYPVYEYRMRFPVPDELPQIARVLREQAGDVPDETVGTGAVSGVTADAEDFAPTPSAQ